MIPYVLTRSRRKTVAIYVRNGAVEVRAPLSMLKKDIDRFVNEKETWILESLAKQRSRAEKKQGFFVDYGSEILYRGKHYPIRPHKSKKAVFDGEVFWLPDGLTPAQIKTVCIQMYRQLAKAYITNRVAAYAARMGVQPSAVKINNAMKRWGSCSSKKNLNFSWRLVMSADNAIDYVVVHELAHLTEMNHSARFWAVVAAVLPNYRELQTQLIKLQIKLSVEDWGLS